MIVVLHCRALLSWWCFLWLELSHVPKISVTILVVVVVLVVAPFHWQHCVYYISDPAGTLCAMHPLP